MSGDLSLLQSAAVHWHCVGVMFMHMHLDASWLVCIPNGWTSHLLCIAVLKKPRW